MRSLIKSHKRESSEPNGDLLPSPFDLEPNYAETHSSLLPPASSVPQSPTKSSSSPTLNKGRKLQRLFQRSKAPSLNLGVYSTTVLPVSPKKSSPPSIIGTITHEWGSTNDIRNPKTPSTPKLNSLTSSTDNLFQKTPPSKNLEQIRLPSNTVLEIPDKADIKNAHRKAQILTTEKSPMLKVGESTPMDSPKPDNFSSSDSERSEFSFEQDNRAGRNTSIRYYKSHSQQELQNQEVTQHQGYYVNDLVDDNFDDDMNYFDEDDGFNDDEELFNRKYFADDDDGQENEKEKQKEKENIREQLKTSKSINNTVTLSPKRSLKYHQLPYGLEQEFSTKKYSWFSEDENDYDSQIKSDKEYYKFEEDDYLDEINEIPENYESDSSQDTRPKLSKSKSLNSSLKQVKKVVMGDSYKNNKIFQRTKTVTLFERHGLASTPTLTPASTSTSTSTSNTFSYSTPNSSFTSPFPTFLSDQSNVDLSPISEASFDGSP